MLFLPSLPPVTLRDIGLYFVLISFIANLILLARPLMRAKTLFKGRAKDAIREIKKLEIPGLRNFVFKEVVLFATPYPFAIAIFTLVDWNQNLIETIELIPLVVTIIGLGAWIMLDIFHSYNTQIFLHEVIDDLDKFDNKFRRLKITEEIDLTDFDLINKLKLLVEIRNTLKGKAKRITKKVGMDKVVESTSLNLSGFAGKFSSAIKMGINQVDNILDNVELVIDTAHSYVAETLLDYFDKYIANRFEKYINRPNWEVAFWICWAIVPSTWLLLMFYISQMI